MDVSRLEVMVSGILDTRFESMFRSYARQVGDACANSQRQALWKACAPSLMRELAMLAPTPGIGSGMKLGAAQAEPSDADALEIINHARNACGLQPYPCLADEAVEKVVAAFKIEGCTPEEAEAARDRLRVHLMQKIHSPEAIEARRKNAEKMATNEAAWKAAEDAKEMRRQEWKMVHAYRWMLKPIPVWNEDTEKAVMMPLTDDAALVEAIRGRAAEWASGDRRRKLHSHLFDWLGQYNMDWQTIAWWERELEDQFVAGNPNPQVDGTFGLV